METCPKCGEEFPAAEARGGYATLTMFRGGVLDTKLRCPGCGHVFQPRTIRFRALKFVIGASVTIAVAALVYVLVVKSLIR